MAMTIKLKKPIEGQQELHLRDIETGDYIRLGPVMAPLVDENGRKRLFEDACVLKSYLTRISGLTDKQISELSFKDFLAARAFIIGQLAFGGDSESETEAPSS